MCQFQRETDIEEGFQIREQVRQAPEEGCRVQLQEPTQSRQEEGVHLGGGRERGIAIT